MSAGREFHYHWEWVLPASAEALWPLVSDTNRFNRDAGVPAIEVTPAANGAARGLRRLELKRLGVRVAWEELPFEWCSPYRYAVERRYLSGPVATMRVRVQLEPLSPASTRLTVDTRITPRNLLGLLAIPYQIGYLSRRSFGRVYQRYAEAVSAVGASAPPDAAPVRSTLSPSGEQRLVLAEGRLRERDLDARLCTLLTDAIRSGDDLLLARMRPYEFARAWRAQRPAVLELFLNAARAGLLDLQWELLCPLCRGAQAVHGSLRDVTADMRCPSCDIEFTASFENSVELTFRPNPAIRTVQTIAYCVGGPQVTPHIAAQQLLAPGESREIAPVLEAGRYRVRAPGERGSGYVHVQRDGAAAAAISATEDGWTGQEVCVATSPVLTLRNDAPRERLFILERTSWSDDATTAAEVTTLQQFRDLFSSEALRAGEQIGVGSLAVLFTDLCDSTRMYRRLGDAAAFGRVMNHFDVLREAIAAEQGAIVKTIGDSVMAVFREPLRAVRAVLAMQQQLTMETNDPLVLKAGLHYGTCIAVTLNDRLDYFGSTVNAAARLDGLSAGGELVMSDPIACDPEVMELLRTESVSAVCFAAALKGFEDQPFRLWRVSLKDTTGHPPLQPIPARA